MTETGTQGLCAGFRVRRLEEGDVDRIFDLCRGNELFYRYHPPFTTKKDILEDLHALPPGKGYKDKFYLGFFDGDTLVAVMDLILDYPAGGTAFLGFFMVDAGAQGKGLGSRIFQDCAASLAGRGFRKLRLAIDRGNPQSEYFWTKNGFVKTGEEYPNGISSYLAMERVL